jgi:hypothetical protein
MSGGLPEFASRVHKARKPFFFEKKNQKTFSSLGHGPFERHNLLRSKRFLLLFFKKEALS